MTLTLLDPLDPQEKTPLQAWNFEDESPIRVGRSPDNHVVLADILVSRYHLELHRSNGLNQPEVWRLVSQGTNGTFMNGRLVSQSSLVSGSMIQLSSDGPLLKFEIQAQGRASEPQPGCSHAGNPPESLFCVRCGQPVQVQRRIREYQVLRMLGQGGMGTTYLVWVKEPGQGRPQLQVLKEMNADMVDIPKAAELFEREARVLQSLHSPGIPQFFDYFVEGNKKYLVMERVHGQDLDCYIRQQGLVSSRQAIAWMLQVCQVLDYLHGLVPPVIHRDVKPSNLLLRNLDGRIVMIDFGAVKEVGSASTTRIAVEGYSAPEQNQGYPRPQSDLYAVGTTLIYLLTGQNPLRFIQNQGQGFWFDLQGLPGIPPQLQAVIAQTTKANVGDRYTTARELAQALKAAV